ncbi:MAG: hypothetical protein V4635_14120 [Bacteroidota bacterium]
MGFLMRRAVFTILFFACVGAGYSQDEPQTIRVKKESNLVKAVFDNTELRLMAIDRFGNPKDNKIVSFKMWIKGKSETREFDGHNNSLNAEMINTLKKQSRAVKIFFTEITVQEDDGHLVKLPDVIDTWFPDCANCEKGNKRR